MAFQITNPIGTGTDQELVDFTRAAIAQITLHGQAYTTDGRTLTRASLDGLHRQLALFEARVDASAGLSTRNLVELKRAGSAS